MKCVMEVVTKMKCTIKVATEVEGANEMKSVMEVPTEWIYDESKTQKKSLLKIENESIWLLGGSNWYNLYNGSGSNKYNEICMKVAIQVKTVMEVYLAVFCQILDLKILMRVHFVPFKGSKWNEIYNGIYNWN